MTGTAVSGRGFKARLVTRAQRAGLTLTPELADALTAYYELLSLWNRKINLTALDEPERAIDRLFLEPLLAAEHLALFAPCVLDIGSGGGSPAIPLKLVLPTMSLTMVESKARKAAFLREAVRQLRLGDVRVEAARYEELLTRPDLREAADVVTLRAVRINARALLKLQAFLKPGGRFFLFRTAETDEVPGGLPPLLVPLATFSLVEALGSRLVLIEKRRLGVL